jgi:hypothetical protein
LGDVGGDGYGEGEKDVADDDKFVSRAVGIVSTAVYEEDSLKGKSPTN